MTQAELRIIADHMGHNLDIHTDVYRLQSCLLEKTKVARVLLASDSGQLKHSKGKRIDEISGAGKRIFNFNHCSKMKTAIGLMYVISSTKFTIHNIKHCIFLFRFTSCAPKQELGER